MTTLRAPQPRGSWRLPVGGAGYRSPGGCTRPRCAVPKPRNYARSIGTVRSLRDVKLQDIAG